MPEFLKKGERQQVKDHHQVTATVLGRKKEATEEGTVRELRGGAGGERGAEMGDGSCKEGEQCVSGAGVGRRQSQMQRGDCGKDLTGELHFRHINS